MGAATPLGRVCKINGTPYAPHAVPSQAQTHEVYTIVPSATPHEMRIGGADAFVNERQAMFLALELRSITGQPYIAREVINWFSANEWIVERQR